MKQILSRMRRYMVLSFDVWMTALAWVGAFWIRYNFDLPADAAAVAFSTLPYVVVVQGLTFWLFGLYRGIWLYASLSDLKRIFIAVTSSIGVVALALLISRNIGGIPRSVWLLDPLLLIVIMGGCRGLYRLYREHSLLGFFGPGQGEPVIVIGAGDAAANFLKDASKNRRWRVLGCLDDDVAKHHRVIYGVKVLGSIDRLRHFVELYGVKTVILAIPSMTYEERRRVLSICNPAGVSLFTMPSIYDIMNGKVKISELRKIQLDDLLGRQAVNLDKDGLGGLLGGQVVMVTGAGGSIGSELCRQILAYKPKLLVFFESSEPSLFHLEQEFSQKRIDSPDDSCDFVPLIGDVKCLRHLEDVMNRYRPSVVFHAAAYKHVPLMEQGNAWQAIQNNVRGTFNAASAAIQAGAKKFVLISTDKAVGPTNVMGASKRLAEILCQRLQESAPTTSLVCVRFGNVLGSQGSVVPKFRDQIARGGPVTITHPDMLRFLMSIPEASQLVLQAGLMGNGGEIFVLDMGRPIRIVDLARDMIRLSGSDEERIKIVYTGLRPGEKMYEELFNEGETVVPTRHEKLRIARSLVPAKFELRDVLEWLVRETPLDDGEVRAKLRRLIPDYKPSEAEILLSVSGDDCLPTAVVKG